MEESARRVLLKLGRELRRAGIPFQLGGSGLLHAIGLVNRVGDLDIVFPVGAQPGLAEVLRLLTNVEPEFDSGQEPGFLSDFRCRHDLDGQALDLSGGVAMEVDGRVVRLPFRSGDVWETDGESIPLAPLEQWLLIYLVHGSGRADALAPEVDPTAWEVQHRELLLPLRWAQL